MNRRGTFEYRLGRALFLRRVRAGLSRPELAKRIGCSVRTVRRVETGWVVPKRTLMSAWEAELGPVVVKA